MVKEYTFSTVFVDGESLGCENFMELDGDRVVPKRFVDTNDYAVLRELCDELASALVENRLLIERECSTGCIGYQLANNALAKYKQFIKEQGE